jgi:hypothetical protein
MDLKVEIWDAINTGIKVPEESKKALFIRIMRLIEESKKPTGQKLGITVMTPEASHAGNKSAANRDHKDDPTIAKPKSL